MKKSSALFSSILAVSLCVFSFSSIASAKSVTEKEHPVVTQSKIKIEHAPKKYSQKVVAYYADWDIYSGYNVSDIPVNDITDLNYAFANIDQTTGKMVLGDPWADVQKPFPGDMSSQEIKGNIGQLIKLKQATPRLKTIISVGGWSFSGGFSQVASTQQSREIFANSIVDFLRTYQFDGVDIDWEYPVSGGLVSGGTQDKENYTSLLEEIRHQLNQAGNQDHKHYILTLAAGASSSFIKNTEPSKIASLVDWMNLMTYDIHGTWEASSGFNAPFQHDPSGLDDKSAVENYLKAGVPAQKIVLGIPFYGHSWTGCVAGSTNGEFQKCTGAGVVGGTPTYKDVVTNYLNQNGFERFWDSKLKEPWLYNSTTGDFISYEDPQSIGFKTQFIQSHHLGGGMIWELSNDYNNTLINTVGNDLLDHHH